MSRHMMTIKEYVKRAKVRKAKRASKRQSLRLGQRVRRKVLVAKLDALFSVLIRMRDKAVNNGLCVFGCGRPIACAFHFVSRVKYATRWLPINGVGSCAPCNHEMEYAPEKYWAWFRARHGIGAEEMLVSRSRTAGPVSSDELERIKRELETQLATVRK